MASRSGLLEISYNSKVTSVCGEPEGSKDDVSGFLIRLERLGKSASCVLSLCCTVCALHPWRTSSLAHFILGALHPWRTSSLALEIQCKFEPACSSQVVKNCELNYTRNPGDIL